MKLTINLQNTYASLPSNFYSPISPQALENPCLVLFNEKLAQQLGMNLTSDEAAQYLSANKLFENSQPVAMAYAGHQFGNLVPSLGDGRAMLLGEIVTPQNQRYDLHLKGSGQTPYSRRGDGRAALGPMLREYMVSEVMHALNIPTSRSLAVIKTNENVYREEILPGAILARVAASHIRVGTFEYFAVRRDVESLRVLLNYAVERHFPEITNSKNQAWDFILEVARRQAHLVVKWMSVGFVHGVMNTDNMAISGETIDYGPCAFLDEYSFNKTFSSIDRNGRYGFNNQADMVLWNLLCLFYALYPLFTDDQSKLAQELEKFFRQEYEKKYYDLMLQKIGIQNASDQQNRALLDDLIKIMQQDQFDFTLTFRYLAEKIVAKELVIASIFTSSQSLEDWIKLWQQKLQMSDKKPQEIAADMNKINPLFIARNHLVERAISLAVQNDDFIFTKELLAAVTNPFVTNIDLINFAKAPTQDERVKKTFCGT